MRVLLVEVGCGREEFNEPLGIESIAGTVEYHLGIRPELHWLKTGEDPQLDGLAAGDVVGVSLQIDSLAQFDRLYRRLRALPAMPHLVLGNLLPTYAPNEILARYPDAVCVVSEGETAFRRLCEVWRTELTPDMSSVPNLTYLDEVGSLVVTARRLENLDSWTHHPSRDLIPDVLARGGIARVEASRGCHWGRCDFCSVAERHGMGVWRPFNIGWVVEDLTRLSSYGVRSPYFADEDFFGQNYERAEALGVAIIQAKHAGIIDADMNFFISMLASDVHSDACRQALRTLRAAGLREVFVGVEAGDNVQLRRLGKKARNRTNADAVSWARDLDLQIDIGSIMFDPYVTLGQLRSNIAFIESLWLDECDSRVVKALRIQPLTGCTGSYADRITGPLDLGSLTFPYDFVDERVSTVWTSYRAWAAPQSERVDRLLAAARGEVPNETFRLQLKTGLAKVRDADLNALTSLVSAVEAADPSPAVPWSLTREKEALISATEALAGALR